MAVSVRLLGAPSIRWDGADHEPPATRASALAYYLAFQARWVARDELLALFWPEVDESRARTNLRQVLTTLRRMPFCVGVEVEVPRVRWLTRTDLSALRASLARATTSVTGDPEPPDPPGTLLDGFVVRSAESFDGWLEEERTRLLDEFREKWLAVAEDALRRDQVGLALAWWSSWLKVEPLDEPVVGSFLRYCRAAGRAAEGVRAFEAFRTRLARELDLKPTDELAALASQVRQDSGSPAVSVPSSGPGTTASSTAGVEESDSPVDGGLDVALPPLVGRTEELRRLLGALRPPGAVVALVAPGGMGKTRLAQEAIERRGRDAKENPPLPDAAAPQRDAIDASVTAFVALVEVTTVDEAAAAVASVVVPGAFLALPPRDRARAGVAGRRGLVVLDNVEQIEGIEELVDDLRRAAPAVSWLLTSRVAPRVSRAVTMFLGGLATPDEGVDAVTLGGLEASPAAQLFLERARALGRPVNDTEAAAVAKLTRAVGGMPLALELAAGWSQVLALPAVRERMAADTGDAPPPGQQLPERHGSLARVFDRTWQQLPDALRDALLRLGVFVGGCTAEAAAGVAGVDLGTVAELRRHALIEVTQDGRLTQHPVVRQWILQRMADENADLTHVKDAHARYFVRFMQRMEEQGQATGGTAEIAALVAEHGNLEAAWDWAVEHGWWDELMVAGAMTSISYGSVGKVPRWLEMVEAARLRAPVNTLPWCWFETVKTNFARLAATISAHDAYESMRTLLRLARTFDQPVRVGWISFFAAQAAVEYGKRAEARAWTQDALRLWGQAGAVHLLPMAAELALVLTVDLAERQRAIQVLADATERSGSPEYLAKLASDRAWDLATTWGRYSEALRLAEKAAALQEGSGFDLDMASVLLKSAKICVMAGEYDRACSHARRALAAVRPYGTHSHVHSESLRALMAEATWLSGDVEGAERMLEQVGAGVGGALPHSLRVRMALSHGEVGVARKELEVLRRDCAEPAVTRGDYHGVVRLSCLEAAVASAEGNQERAVASLVVALERCVALTFVPASLWALAIAAPLLEPVERERVLRAVAAHPATPHEVRTSPVVQPYGGAMSIAATARLVRAYPAMQRRVLAALKGLGARSEAGTTTR